MGFGILFVGYFLLLNISTPELTDAVAAAVMLYAFYKLKEVCPEFKKGVGASLAFLIFGLFELFVAVSSTLGIISLPALPIGLIPMIRHLLAAVCSFLMLLGMRETASEVELPAIAKKCNRNLYLTAAVYGIHILLEAESVANLLPAGFALGLYITALVVTLARLAVIILNLSAIYSCYMRICMPGQEDPKPKQSRFGFVNDFRKHQEDKQREYAEYRLEKLKSKKNKKRKK